MTNREEESQEHRLGLGAQLESIVAGLQRAALNSGEWTGVSKQIDDAAGIMGSHLAVLSERGSPHDFLFSRLLVQGEPREEIERLYVEEYAALDERVTRVADLPIGRLLLNKEILSEHEQKASPVYADFLPSVGSNNQIVVRLKGLADTHVVWTLSGWPGRDWLSEQTGVVNRLLPHLRHFVRVRQALAAADARSVSLAELLDRTGLGVVHLDREGRVLEANEPARSFLRSGDCLTTRSGGQLGARWRSDDAKLGRLITACCRDGVGGSMTVRSTGESSVAGPLAMHACPVPPDRTTFDTRAVAAQVLLTELGSGPAVDPAPVAAAYDLTCTESRVAASLAEGLTVREIAAATGRRESTVRWHVKNLHSKLGVHRQTDLVRLVLSAAVSTSPFDGEE